MLFVCLQEGQQPGEGGDQGVPGEQEDLSGRGGTSHRSVAARLFVPLSSAEKVRWGGSFKREDVLS